MKSANDLVFGDLIIYTLSKYFLEFQFTVDVVKLTVITAIAHFSQTLHKAPLGVDLYRIELKDWGSLFEKKIIKKMRGKTLFKG